MTSRRALTGDTTRGHRSGSVRGRGRAPRSRRPAVLRRAARARSRRGGLPGDAAGGLRHYDELHNPAAVGGWLFSIAQREIIDTARSRARAPIASDRLEEHAAAWHDPDPADGVWSQVAALPGKQREAVALRYLADLSHADIATVMDTTPEAARRNVFEGLRRLRKELTDGPDR